MKYKTPLEIKGMVVAIGVVTTIILVGLFITYALVMGWLH